LDSIGLLRRIEGQVETEFKENRRVLSFDEYFELFAENPALHLRTAAHYLRDCMDFYGKAELPHADGAQWHFKLFDMPFDAGKNRLVGHEQAQTELYKMLQNFIRDGRVTRLVLLHGPNGSAKSSFVACLARALEHYSTQDAGAAYRFSWVFPTDRISKGKLGFGSDRAPRAGTGFAHLDEDEVAARLPGDLCDHPLLLLPVARRKDIFAAFKTEGKLHPDHPIGQYLLEGDLAPRSKAVANALLNAYQGDYRRMLEHVQVERLCFSQRYRAGLVTIEPQMHVDAAIRQVTSDEGLASLPPSLRHLTLYEPLGDLVDANRGLCEYNDLLKKPIDAFKYLLATCEKGSVTLPNAILHLDLVLIASSNELHLAAFKQYQDFTSFKGRFDLVRMPYLRNYVLEQTIYDDTIAQGGLGHLVTPHSSYVLALWGILTRLKRPQASQYPEQARKLIGELTPLEKADLYAGTAELRQLTAEQQRELRGQVKALSEEGQDEVDYEGSFGASPRLLKQLMLNALQNEAHYGLSPLSIFAELRELCAAKSMYDWLKREPERGYHDHEGFIELCHERWLGRVQQEVQEAMGLVSQQQYLDLFTRYIRHTSYLLKGERIWNELTGRSEDPDAGLIERLEGIWKVGGNDTFRRDLIARIGAWRVGHPGQDIDYRGLFAELFEALEEDYYERQRATIRKVTTHALEVLAEEEGREGPLKSQMSQADRERASTLAERLVTDFHYPRAAVREVLSALLKARL
jgi:predicted Ser/Thr protein kinase